MESNNTSGSGAAQPDEEGVCLTVQQRFFWDRPGGDAGLHALIPFPFVLIGSVDPERLSHAIRRLIDRHDVLQTRIIPSVGFPPRQRFARGAAFSLENVDLSDFDLDGRAPEEKLQSELLTRCNRRIALDTDRLFEVTLFKLAEDRHVLVLWVNHLLCDGYSPSLLLQDLWASYAGSSREESHDEPMQYSQYCAWQQEVLERWLSEQRPYWTSRLSGAVPIQWPQMSAAPLAPRGVSEGIACTVDAATTARLRAQATRSRKHLSLFALTAYAAAIQERCNQSDFVLAIMATGRLAKEHLGIVGYLAQPLYLRVQMPPVTGFGSLLDTISREYFGALFHGDFGQSVQENPALGADTLFQWFPADWRLTPPPSLSLGFRVERLSFKHPGYFHEKFKLGVFVYEADNELSIRGAFRPDSVRRSAVEQLLADICERLKRQAASGP
jgi:hypothetical protein